MNISVILPSYNPNEQMIEVVQGLLKEGFTDIIVVNDGSNELHMEPFHTVAAYPEVTLLTHEVNKGKGRALKTGFSYCMEHRPVIDGVVTVDGDNQHRSPDIKACCEALVGSDTKVVLGCRQFNHKDVPWKSRVGNNITKVVFRLMCGIRISDTQTGLRAFSKDLLPQLIEMKGERFEYETQMLLELKKAKIDWLEVPIETVYIEDNSETHFHPIRDSFKIYRVIFKFTFLKLLTFIKFSIGSITSFLIDIGVYFLSQWLLSDVIKLRANIQFSTDHLWGKILGFLLKRSTTMSAQDAISTVGTYAIIATVTSRLISSIYNYFYNKNVVFKNGSRFTILKYYTLALCQMLISGLLVSVLSMQFAANSWVSTAIKMLVDFALFFASYQIQRQWVFKSSAQRKEEKRRRTNKE